MLRFKLTDFSHRDAQQRRHVIGQHFGRHIEFEGMLRQAADAFQMQPMFEPLERLLDAPSLVIERAEVFGSGQLAGHVSHQHPNLPVGADLTNEAHCGGLSIHPPALRVRCARPAKADEGLARIGMNKEPRGQVLQYSKHPDEQKNVPD